MLISIAGLRSISSAIQSDSSGSIVSLYFFRCLTMSAGAADWISPWFEDFLDTVVHGGVVGLYEQQQLQGGGQQEREAHPDIKNRPAQQSRLRNRKRSIVKTFSNCPSLEKVRITLVHLLMNKSESKCSMTPIGSAIWSTCPHFESNNIRQSFIDCPICVVPREQKTKKNSLKK